MSTSETPNMGDAAASAAKEDMFAENKRNFSSDIAAQHLRNVLEMKSGDTGAFLNKLKNPPKEAGFFDILGGGRSGHN